MNTLIRKLTPLIGLLTAALACSLGGNTPPQTVQAGPLATTLVGAATLAPVVTMTSPPLATRPPAPSSCADSLIGARTRYNVNVEIDAQARSAKAQVQINYRNITGVPLNNIVFNIDPNRVEGLFKLDEFSVVKPESQPADYTLNGARMEVPLSKALEPGCEMIFKMAISLRVLPLTDARMKYLSYTERQLTLGYWLPEVAPFLKGAWRTPKSWSVGEYTYADPADYEVRATVQGKENVEIIGPGKMERVNNGTWTFTLANARSFTLVVTDSMSRINTTTKDSIVIDLYYFTKGQPTTAPDGKPISGPTHALEVARESAERFTTLYGPLSLKRLVIVEGDFADGMEFSGIAYVGHQWFAGFQGKLDSWLTLITAHEVAHQWWYMLVSSNQGENPYLDEMLAIYSEMLYLESKQPDLVAWWWAFRVIQYQPKGYVDSVVYEYWNSRVYINAVYLRGASMLQEIRGVLGDEAFFAWLRNYASMNAGRIVTPEDFWGAMGKINYLRTAEIRFKYLRNPDPLYVTSETLTATASMAPPRPRPTIAPTGEASAPPGP